MVSEQARMKVSIEEETSLREDAINEQFTLDKNYRPYNEDISIFNNTYTFGSFRKQIQSKDGFLFSLGMGFKDAHIWFDGVNNPDGNTLCFEEKEDILIADFDFLHDNENANLKSVSSLPCDDQSELTVN